MTSIPSELFYGALEGLAIWVPITLVRYRLRRNRKPPHSLDQYTRDVVERPVSPLPDGPERIGQAKTLIADYEATVHDRFRVACALRVASTPEQKTSLELLHNRNGAWLHSLHIAVLSELVKSTSNDS